MATKKEKVINEIEFNQAEKTKKPEKKIAEETKAKSAKSTYTDPYVKSLLDAGYVLTDVEGDKVWVKK